MQADPRRKSKYSHFFPLQISKFHFYTHVCLSFQLLEMFGSGTACIVSPIERISYLGTNLMIPTMEQEKPMFARILETLTAIQYGKIDHPWAVAID